MRAIRKMQRVILALFILTLLAFCGLRIYRRLTVDVTPPVSPVPPIPSTSASPPGTRPCCRGSWPPTTGTGT